MTLKIAIVGCGQIADGHVSEIDKIEGADVVACCDLELLMAEQLAVRYGIPQHFDDFGAMLEQARPDVVHIATPPSSHLSLALEALAAGCHLYVEKPFALNYADSLQLVQAAEAANRKLTIGHTYEFDPPAEKVRRLIERGKLGDCVHVESHYGYNLDGPFGKVILGSPDHWVHHIPGKLFQNNLNHLLNKISEFIDDERPEIRAMAWRRRESNFGDIRDEMLDELRVMIRGEKVSGFGTFTSHVQPVAHFMRLYGTMNTIHADFNTRTVTLEQGPTLPSAIGRVVPGFKQSWQYMKSASGNVGSFARSQYHFFAGLNLLISRFYGAIRGEGPLPVSYRDILRLSWMLDEIWRQIGSQGNDR